MSNNAKIAALVIVIVLAAVVAVGVPAMISRQTVWNVATIKVEASDTGPSRQTTMPKSRVLLAHYLPWYEAAPERHFFGWHWTMQHFDPNQVVDGRRQVASHFYPLIGIYDSADPAVIEYHVLLMKLAGIDGAVLDWYGTDNYLDFGLNHTKDQAVAKELQKAGLKFAALYEDEVEINRMINDGKLPADQAAQHGEDAVKWLNDNWFSNPDYVRLDDRPILLSFGTKGYFRSDQWDQIFSDLPVRPELFTETIRRSGAIGGFSWPAPFKGTQGAFDQLTYDYSQGKIWTRYIPVAFPRFHDIYAEAGTQPSWGSIDDQNGKTYEQTLTRALQSTAPVVQIGTWNDYGEGTQIEPTREFGYRDLETTQRLVKKYLNPSLKFTAKDLRLPYRLYTLRKSLAGNSAAQSQLDGVAQSIIDGNTAQAGKVLAALEKMAPARSTPNL